VLKTTESHKSGGQRFKIRSGRKAAQAVRPEEWSAEASVFDNALLWWLTDERPSVWLTGHLLASNLLVTFRCEYEHLLESWMDCSERSSPEDKW